MVENRFQGQLSHRAFTGNLVSILKSHNSWPRAVSIDLETKVLDNDGFLAGERILAAGVARRSGNEVETGIFKLRDETDDAEVELLNRLGAWLGAVKPLVLLGYNISGYDLPLLGQKVNWYNRQLVKKGSCIFPKEYWALKDALTTSYVIDMMQILKATIAQHEGTAPKYRSLEYIVGHELFRDIKLMRTKALLACAKEEKGRKIYELWKGNRPEFAEYLKGDVHDVLLLAEHLFGIGTGSNDGRRI